MSHKVNPFSFRLVNTKDLVSKWFTRKNMSVNIAQDLQIRMAVNKKYGKTAGISRVEISRDTDAIIINIL